MIEITEPIKKLFHSGYYDGPLTGLCEYQGKKYWFDSFDEGGWDCPTKNELKLIESADKRNIKLKDDPARFYACNIQSDYPLEGILEFQFYDDGDPTEDWIVCRPRKYHLIELSEEDIETLEEWHKLFEFLVKGDVKHDINYWTLSKSTVKKDFSKNNILGWFTRFSQ